MKTFSQNRKSKLKGIFFTLSHVNINLKRLSFKLLYKYLIIWIIKYVILKIVFFIFSSKKSKIRNTSLYKYKILNLRKAKINENEKYEISLFTDFCENATNLEQCEIKIFLTKFQFYHFY